MFKLKRISKAGISAALEKAERYRLLNDPSEAESICLDVLEIDPKNQKAIVALILSMTDQFGKGSSKEQASEILPRLTKKFERVYYAGIICERQAKAVLHRGTPGSHHDAYQWYREAMEHFEKAQKLSPRGNDGAILRWNACARMIQRHRLSARTDDKTEHFLE